MSCIAIIPARGGSKGVPNKNMQLLEGKPLVLHAIDTAIQSHVFDRIIISSDDETILNCASNRKEISIPFKRPHELAKDDSLIVDVIAHLLSWLKTHEQYEPDSFMLLEPTCPLRKVDDILKALQLFRESKKPCLISVGPVQQHPSNMIYDNAGNWDYCLTRKKVTRGRQDFYDAWFINGGVYITNTVFFNATHKIYDLAQCEIYKMPYERSIDINTPYDLAMARVHKQIDI